MNQLTPYNEQKSSNEIWFKGIMGDEVHFILNGAVNKQKNYRLVWRNDMASFGGRSYSTNHAWANDATPMFEKDGFDRPPRSSVLAPIDFFLQGYLKSKVYIDKT